MVNFVGAVVFSVIGILYLKHRGKGKLAASLIPQVRDTDAETSEKIENVKDRSMNSQKRN